MRERRPPAALATDPYRDPEAGSVQRAPARRAWARHAIVAAILLAVVAPLAWLSGGLARTETDDRSALLPPGSEAGAVQTESKGFSGLDAPSAILVYTRPAGTITDDDRTRIATVLAGLTDRFGLRLAQTPPGPSVTAGDAAIEVVVRLPRSDPAQVRDSLDALRVKAAQVPDLHLELIAPAPPVPSDAGPGWAVAALGLGAVLMIVLLGYRSVALALVVLGTVAAAVGVADGVAYLLAAHRVLTLTGHTLVLLNVVVMIAGTDYALVVATAHRTASRPSSDRYTALRACALPVASSAACVISGLLCLRAAALGSTRALGPLLAIGVEGAALLALVLLPNLLALAGRRALGSDRRYAAPVPGRGARLRTRPWARWTLTALVLCLLAGGTAVLRAHEPAAGSPAPSGGSVTGPATSLRLGRPDPTPIVVTANEYRLDAVLGAARRVAGVEAAEPYLARGPVGPGQGLDTPPVMVVDGRAAALVLVHVPPDSPLTRALVERLRTAVHAVPGADAQVGGYPADAVDLQNTAWHDRVVVIPLALGVILAVLVALSRRVVVPASLALVVGLAALATLGGCRLVASWLGLPEPDDTFPLSVFVILVVLTVDHGVGRLTRVPGRGPGRWIDNAAASMTPRLAGVAAGVVGVAAAIAVTVPSLRPVAAPAFAVALAVILEAVIRALVVPARAVGPGTAAWMNLDPTRRRQIGKHHVSPRE